MTDEHEPVEETVDEQERAREDTEAILSRRAFLIQSALAGAGVAAGAAGCDKKGKPAQAPSKPRPQICLKKRGPRPDGSLRPCLSVRPPEEPPRPMTAGDPKPGMNDGARVPMGRACLGLRQPDKPKPRPKVCLSVRKRRPPKRRKKPRGRICLSPID